MITQLRPFECTQFYMTLTWLLVVGSMLAFSLAGRNENPSCIEKERQALLRFKHGIIDTHNSLSSWNSEDGNCCRWVGISCDNETGYVVALDLGCTLYCYKILAGELSPSLHELSYLSHLDLSGNNFTANINFLNELGNLSNLKYLDLSSNAQLKVDTLEWVSGLSSLTYLGMNDLDLSSIADWVQSIKKLPMLKNLHLSHCQLQTPGISNSSLRFLGHLKTLDLSNNNLTGNFLHILEVFNVGSNSLNLTLLDLSFNSLEGVISESFLSCLPNLKLLGLSHNLLTLSLSSAWVPPLHLKVMKLSSCNLGPNFPAWLHTHMDFEYLDISCNGIRDFIPDWFWNLSYELRYLNLSYNSLSGTLPNTTLDLENNCQIDLSYNEFAGEVMPFFSKARLLNLSKNKFFAATSFLCSSMVDSRLAYVDLSDNLLSGKLPDCHMNFSNLFILNLANNNLSGKIPRSLGSLEFLTSLDLSNNSFSGELPSSLQNKSNLLFLDLGENQLSGRVPGWNGQNNLVFLRLQSNKFHGEIPSSLCQFSSIQVLDLSLNNLSGEVPSCFSNFTAMSRKTSLNNYYYEFYHSILSTEDNGYKFEVDYRDGAWFAWKGLKAEYHNTLALLKLIDLSANQLTGQIPEGLTILYELVSLNLSRNHFSGNIPETIGQLTQLNSLDLSNNRLSGRIPISMAKIYFLEYLDLSNNDLCGAIPKGTQLQSFDASKYGGNPQLCGLPTLNVCPGDEILPRSPPGSGGNKHDHWKENMGFYISLIFGFAIGFCGVCWTLLLRSSCGFQF
ncbi:PREDICTED: leucine-rich repeat receptor-like protein kinase PXC2 [Ipomoea nil]|uniref:leucine-rich repeat receptor-like protein kinase PXC2 n=1 Tax=Ipomoea nil TaxID=35883 RepID=UPI0009018C4F|nr:PREDICTED: leucine-rich repeat receptor-like protein kinase PXC2 [Ipomoea nil]